MSKVTDVIVIGAGIAGLSAAALLSKRGLKIEIFEQNWLPGGCTSSYPRHGYIFEAGATTLVGLDKGMPLRQLLDETGIKIDPIRLKVPMQIHLADGQCLTRYESLNDWIAEAERVFGKKGQRAFWEYCFKIAENVWEISGQQRHFPPSRFSDLMNLAKNFSLGQLKQIPLAFQSTLQLLEKFGLADNSNFLAFVEEQLLITAQNSASEVNALFGATALCYTNFGNYYMPGGMLKLVQPLVDFVEENGGKINLRRKVIGIEQIDNGYLVKTEKHGDFKSRLVLSAIPLNNTLPMFDEKIKARWSKSLMEGAMLRSAFSMGIAFKKHREFEVLHHQIHLDPVLPELAAKSIFLSLSHPEDTERCGTEECVASISTHIYNPHEQQVFQKADLENAILDVLEEKGFLRKENILYQHSSTQKAWEKWTGRAYGFVGGYPQYKSIKPWQMKDARLDGKGAYICGDSTYPGQGIPGACLSGIAAFAKMMTDNRL